MGVDPGKANAEIPATELHLLDLPRRVPDRSPSPTLLEVGSLSGDLRFEGLSDHAMKQKCQRINRRLRAIQRAFEASLNMPDALECLRQAPPEIVDRVTATDLVALVMTDGSVAFPTWQFNGGFEVRSDLRPILDYASNAGFTHWALHLLLTKPMRHRGGTTFAAELHQQAIGEDRGDLLDEIMAATVEAAEQSAELRKRRDTVSK
jgi:hypothetical protein